MGFVGSPDGSAGNGGYGELGDDTGDWSTANPTSDPYETGVF